VTGDWRRSEIDPPSSYYGVTGNVKLECNVRWERAKMGGCENKTA